MQTFMYQSVHLGSSSLSWKNFKKKKKRSKFSLVPYQLNIFYLLEQIKQETRGFSLSVSASRH